MSSQPANFTTGDGRVLSIKDIAGIYRNVVNLASPSSGRIQNLDESNYSLTCRFKTTDCDTLESINTSKAYSLKTTVTEQGEPCIESVRCITEHQTVSEHVVTSNNGRYLARIRGPSKNSPSGSDPSDIKQLLEIWDRSRLLKTIDISEIDAHGSINTDPQFGSMSWYPFGNQNKLVYVCHKKCPKFQSFFKQAVPDMTTHDDVKEAGSRGKQLNLGDDFAREDDWGECLNGIQHTLVAVLDIANNFNITTIDVNGCSLGNTKWLDDFKTVSVAYPEEPRRIGLVYCNSRNSHLIIHDWSQPKPNEVFTMKSNSHSYHTPRVDHSGRRFIYLKNPMWGPHRHSVRLHIHDLNTNHDLELTDKITGEADLFETEPPENCFSNDDKHILLVKSDYLHNHMCLYSLQESKFTKIKFPTTGVSLLDFKHNVILASGSEVNATPTLFVALLNQAVANPGELVAWHQIEDCIHLEEIDYDTFKIPTSDDSSFVSALLVKPNIDMIRENCPGAGMKKGSVKSSELPTVVLVHGGPHSQFIVTYLPSLVFYAYLGLRTILINYRGSIGVSQEYIKSLVGKVGYQDIDDCVQAIRYFVRNKLVNPKKLIIQGGSHGGFIACHLSCQDEFKFTSAIIRNPVVDISTMHSTTDIPDWCYAVALGQERYDPSWVPSSEDLAKMFECSPMSKHKLANVPTLMQLGNKDRRVPMFQGERWIELLKARGIKTKCKLYADKHALDKPETMADATISASIWILSNL